MRFLKLPKVEVEFDEMTIVGGEDLEFDTEYTLMYKFELKSKMPKMTKKDDDDPTVYYHGEFLETPTVVPVNFGRAEIETDELGTNLERLGSEGTSESSAA